jgi:FkbM family methyltransferase
MLTKVRRALASRYLFDNWLSLLIKFALTRLGFNVKLVTRVGDCTFELSREVFERFVSRFSRGFIKSVGCVNGRLLVNGVEVDRIDDVIRDTETWARVLGWAYDTVNGFWFKGNAKFRHMRSTILEIFDYGEYVLLDVKGKDIVDVGAFIGDSAIYFALRGARKVIAIEPHPGAFAEMLDNIKLNNMENVIIPINVGLASRPGKICIENVSIDDTSVTYHRPGDCSNTVPAITLSELISRFGIDPNDAVLKMDCQGCEFDIILNDYKHVKLFRELIFEYYLDVVGTLNDLLKMLNKDYKCRITRSSNIFGIIHCIRK